MIAIRAYPHNTLRILQVNTRRILNPSTYDGMDDRRIMKAERLRGARQARYGTVAEAALAFGFKKPTLTSHENGTRPFDDEDAIRYGKAFKVTPAWLLCLDNDRSRAEVADAVNAEMLGPILRVALRRAPKGGWKETDASLLATGVEDALRLLSNLPAKQASGDALEVAGQAAFAQLFEKRPQA